MSFVHALGAGLLVAVAACGQVKAKPDAALPIDASVDAAVDAGPDASIDAAVDAGVDAAATPPGQETTTAGARLSSPTYTLDVQVGHPIDQGEARGSTFRVEGNAPVKP